MKINNYSDNFLINSLSQKNRSINSVQKSLNALKSLNNFNNIGTVIKDIKMSKIESEVRGTAQGNKNIQDGVSLIQTATGSLDKMQTIGEKIRELAIKHDNDTLTDEQKVALEEEAKMYYKELGETMKNTYFNKNQIFSKDEYFIQTGAYNGDNYTIKLNGIGKHFEDIFHKIYETIKEPPREPVPPIKPPVDTEGDCNGGIRPPPIDQPEGGGNGDGNGEIEGGGGVTPPEGGGTNPDNNLTYKKVYKNGQIFFEGWVDSNNKAQNYGITYNENGLKTFEGEMKDGLANGKGILYYSETGIQYKGEFKDGKFNGQGELFSKSNELVYRGSFKNGIKSGTGVEFDKLGKYKEGLFENGTLVTEQTTDLDKSFKSIITYDFSDKKSDEVEHIHINDTRAISKTSNEEKLSMKDLLNLDFIDNKILNHIQSTNHSLKVQEDILGMRTNLNDTKIDVYEDYVKTKAIDQYSELINKLNQDKVSAQLISSLYAQSLDQRRDNILNLLYN